MTGQAPRAGLELPEHRLGVSALGQFGSTVFGMLAGVGLSILVARALGPSAMGSYTLAMTLVTALEAVAGLGLARTAVKFAAELHADPTAAPPAMAWLLARRATAGAIAAGLLLISAPTLGALFHEPDLPMLLTVGAALLVCNLLGNTLESALEGFSRFDLLAGASIGLTPLYVISTLVALALGGGAVGVVLAQVVAGVVTLGAYAALGRRAGVLARSPGVLEPALHARLVRFARRAYLLSLLAFVVQDRVEVLVLGALQPEAQVGLYSVALSAAEAAMRLGPAMVATVYFPVLTAALAADDHRRATTNYEHCLRYLAVLVAPLVTCGIALAESGVAVVFGPQYVSMVPVLRIALVAAALAAWAQAPEAALTAAERQRDLLAVHGAVALVNVALDLLLVPALGAVGAASAILLVALAQAFALGWLTVHRLGLPSLPVGLGRILVAASLGGVVARVAADGGEVGGLALGLASGSLTYLGVLTLTRFFGPEDVALLQRRPWRAPSG